MTDRWKQSAEVRMEEMRVTRAALARQLGVIRAAITKLFDEQQASALVPAICDYLALPLPLSESDDDASARIAQRVSTWTDEQKVRMLELMDVIEKMIT